MFAKRKTPAKQDVASAGNRGRRRAPQLETLESRSMMAIVGMGVVSNTLYITCDDAADTVTVSQAGQYAVVQHSANGVTNNYTLGPSINRAEIRAGGGNDTVRINGGINAVIYGGAGHDRLYGGSIDDAIYGDADGDLIYGGGGWDYLHGGEGTDTLYGDAGNDRLFGGDGPGDSLYGNAGDDFIDAGSAAEINSNGSEGNDFNAWAPVVNGASFNDISQGNSNNCFILASMGEAAQNGVDLASRITYRGNGNYDVALFRRNSDGSYSPTTVSVAFSGMLNTTDPAAHFRGQEGESWPIIMNRAIAQLLNVNLSTTTGGYAGNVLGAIVGRAPSTTTWSDASGGIQDLPDGLLNYLHQVGNSRPTVVATTGAAAVDTSLFVRDHVYMVHSVLITGYIFNRSIMMNVPQYTVLLYNPHGVDNQNAGKVAGIRSSGDNSDGLIAISGAEFRRSFGEITTI